MRRGSRSSAACVTMPARRSAQAEFDGIARSQKAASPEKLKEIVGARVETIPEAAIGGIGRQLFLIVMAVVMFVLVIAGANVANLLLLRSAARAREMALRTAMGATRWRLVRQLLLESLVLVARRRRVGDRPCPGRGAGIRRGDAEWRAAVLGGVLDRLRRVRVCRRDRDCDGDRVRAGAGAARLAGPTATTSSRTAAAAASEPRACAGSAP